MFQKSFMKMFIPDKFQCNIYYARCNVNKLTYTTSIVCLFDK